MEATQGQLEAIESKSRANMVRNAKGIELEREISRLKHQVDISDRAAASL